MKRPWFHILPLLALSVLGAISQAQVSNGSSSESVSNRESVAKKSSRTNRHAAGTTLDRSLPLV
jgi:hypothetical protein